LQAITNTSYVQGDPDEFVKKSPKIQSKNPFSSKLMHKPNNDKSGPKIWATYFLLKKPPKVYNHPMGEKFAQSGHPAYVRGLLSYSR
jgi:hypothetical protein